MATIGQTGVVIELEEYARALERAAHLGVEAGKAGTAVELTAKGIAGTVLLETVAQQKQPLPGHHIRGAQER